MVQSKQYHIRSIIIIIISFFITFGCAAKDFVVVIDAGHGGHDKGALGLNSYEKNINLAVALKLGKMITSDIKDVKVVYTRDEDKYLTLQERANLANKAGGDLFISIHTNSIALKAKNRRTISGASTYTLGLHRTDENLEVAKLENSVIALEDDYTTTYQGFDPNSTESYIIFEISQSKHMEQSVNFASAIQKEFVSVANRDDKGVRQAGFWVLAATSMPAVLVELDFICNPTQEQFLTSEDGQNKMARAIFNAFKSYKNSGDKKIALVSTTSVNSNKKEKGVVKESEKEKVATANKENEKIYVAPSYNTDSKTVSEDDYKYSLRRTGKKDKTKKDNPATKQKNETQKKENKSKADEEIVEVQDNKNANDTKSAVTDKETKVIYRIQFLTSPKALSGNSAHLKGLYPVANYKDGGVYKYTYGETTNEKEAKRLLNYVKTKFKEAFIVSFKDGERIN